MTNLVITDVHIVESHDQFDAPAEEIFGFEAVRYGTTGITPANGTTSAEANFQGIATVAATRIGQAITVVRDGLLDVGPTALDGLAFGAPIYLSDTDGTLSDSAGDSTVDVIIGRVAQAHGATPGTVDRLLRVRKEG